MTDRSFWWNKYDHRRTICQILVSGAGASVRAALFCLEPDLEPTQFGWSRSRLRDLGLLKLELPKKVVAPQHWVQDRRDAGQVGYRTGEMQDRWNAGQVECRTGGMQDRWDEGSVVDPDPINCPDPTIKSHKTRNKSSKLNRYFF